MRRVTCRESLRAPGLLYQGQSEFWAVSGPFSSQLASTFPPAARLLSPRYKSGRNCHEILRDVKVTIRSLHDPNPHVGVIRVQDVGPMIVLETGLVHKCAFRAQNGFVDGNILSRSPPGNSGRVYSRRKGPAVRVNMVKESLPEHVPGMRSRHRSQVFVPPEGLRSATSLGGGLGSQTLVVDERPHLPFQISHAVRAEVLPGSRFTGTNLRRAMVRTEGMPNARLTLPRHGGVIALAEVMPRGRFGELLLGRALRCLDLTLRGRGSVRLGGCLSLFWSRAGYSRSPQEASEKNG